MATSGTRELVLVGGGHAHVQVLRRFAMRPPPGVRVTLVVDTPLAVYSGMVPGHVAGAWPREALEIDVVPLARRAGARVVLAAATAVDAGRRRIALAGRPALPYDVASLDVGATVAGLERPGVREHALPTRPIGRFVERLEAELARARGAGALHALVVGGGVGGAELALTLRARLLREGVDGEIELVQRDPVLVPRFPARLRQRLEQQLRRAGIGLRVGCEVVALEDGSAQLDRGAPLRFDLLLWVTGAAGHAFLKEGDLPLDPGGFVRIGPTLQVEGFPGLFAAGDCASALQPWVEKSGVFAVRQGPVLAHNLRVALGGGRLRRYRPQRRALALLHLGGDRALGVRGQRVFEGRLALRLKNHLDRRFVRRFQLLDGDGAPTGALPEMPSQEMRCGGCAAKLPRPDLERALARLPAPVDDASVRLGLSRPDDAAALRRQAGGLRLSSVDAFRAFADDPYLVGRVAAVNAVSDLLAKGATPRFAQALVGLPEDAADEETLVQVLAGARAALDPLRVTLLGGHTTTGPELWVGFHVEGELADETALLPLDGLRPGQALVLSQGLGTGVLLHADAQGRCRGPWLASALEAMQRPNREAAEVARRFGATAATDVTGFGLAGHLAGMLGAAELGAELFLDALPALPGAVELLARGLRSTFHPANEAAGLREIAGAACADHPRQPLLFDPQTSGGLLFGLPAPRAEAATAALRAAGDRQAAVVGRVTAGASGAARLRLLPAG